MGVIDVIDLRYLQDHLLICDITEVIKKHQLPAKAIANVLLGTIGALIDQKYGKERAMKWTKEAWESLPRD
jgi:hypothetical protein